MEKNNDSQFNDRQRAVLDSKAALLLCVAGPGSGKTHTLVGKVRKLVDEVGHPERIVVVTYTCAAAGEFERRLGMRLGYVGTLHGFMLRLLKDRGALVGLPPSLSVVDDDQKAGIVETIVEELKSKASERGVAELLEREDLVHVATGTALTREEIVAVEYHRRLRRAGLLDYFTILHYGLKLVSTYPDAFAAKYDHLFVDEVQDSSDVDFAIYEALRASTKMMIGDPDQAIYGFRGGNVRNVLALSQDKGWETHSLEANHRSLRRVCEAAHHLITSNAGRFPKLMTPAGDGGAVIVERFHMPIQEMSFVAGELVAKRGPGQSNVEPNKLATHGGAAVLARTNRQARAFADHLKAMGIPVAERKIEKDPEDWRRAKLLLTVLANPWCDVAFHQYVALRDGKAAAKAMKHRAAVEMKPMFKLHMPTASMFGVEYGLSIPAMLAREGISLESGAKIHAAVSVLNERGDWGYADLVVMLSAKEEGREIGAGVTVTTFHSAKGREWDTVFLVGCEEGVIPSGRADADVEEERRLMFVAMTRAKTRLVITWCDARPQSRGPNLPPGPMEPREPSRFIKEAGL